MSTSWGSLVARELALLSPLTAVACGATQPEPIVPPPNAPPTAMVVAAASAPAPIAPAPPSPELGPFVEIAPAGVPAQPFPVKRLSARASSFAIELADLRREWGVPVCPVTSPGCNLVAIAPYRSPLGARERLGTPEPAGLGGFSVPSPGSAPYTDLSSGKNVVYGARAERHLVIDRIDAKGTATPLLDDANQTKWTSTKVLELDGVTVVVGSVEGDDGVAALRVGRVDPKADGGALVDVSSLPYGLVPAYRPSAQGARQADIDGTREAVWGPIAVTPLLDASGNVGTKWALALMQVNAPPFNWKAGRAYTKPDPQSKEGKRRGKHGCGGPGSRSLTDRSVEKVLRVLRFDGPKLVSDTAVDHPTGYDPHIAPLTVAPADDGALVVDGVTYGVDGKHTGKRAPVALAVRDVKGLGDFTFAEPPPLGALGYDAAAKEGWVSVGPWGESLGIRFDAAGKANGPAIQLRTGGERLVHAGDAWVTWDSSSIGFLSGPNKGKSMAWTSQDGWAIDAVAKGSALELLLGNHDRCHTLTVDVTSMDEKKSPDLALCSPDRELTFVKLGTEGADILLREGEEPELVDREGKTTPLPPESKPPGEARGSHVVPVFGDAVLVRHGTVGSTLTWLRARKVVPFVEAVVNDRPMRRRGRRGPSSYSVFPAIDGAPFLSEGLLLPDEPGPPIDAALLREAAEKGCSKYRPTGPRTAILGCVGATDAKTPGVAYGLRTFRY